MDDDAFETSTTPSVPVTGPIHRPLPLRSSPVFVIGVAVLLLLLAALLFFLMVNRYAIVDYPHALITEVPPHERMAFVIMLWRV